MYESIWPPIIRLEKIYLGAIKRLIVLSSLLWLCFGDFNGVLNLNEKLRRGDKRVSMVNNFREAIKDCDLMDLESIRYHCTWSNRRSA